MKNFARTGKKTLALFLAVVMVMTAWVFFAPEKAEAVTSGSYTYRVRVGVVDTFTGNKSSCTVTFKTNNGKGSDTTATHSFSVGSNSAADKGGHYYLPSESGTTSTSFPYKAYITAYKNSGPSWGWKTDGQLDVRLELYYDGSWHEDFTSAVQTNKVNGHGTMTATTTAASSKYPYAQTVVFDQDPSNVTLSASGTDVTTTFRTHVNDQYGVRIASAASTYSKSASLSSNRNYTTGYSAVYGNTTDGYDPCTITMTKDARILDNYDDNTITATASYTFNGQTRTASRNFVITDPNYVFYLNPNGGSIYHNNTWYSNQQQYTKRYGNTLPASQCPTQGRRTGYEFIGMYSGSAKADNFSFTKPVAGTTSGYTGQLTTNTKYTANTYWYAAWWAKNVTATFINNDGQEIGRVTGKYDKTISEVAAAAVDDLGRPEYHKGPNETGTYDYRFIGWEVVEAYDIDGNRYYGNDLQDPNTAILKGNTVFRAKYSTDMKDYTVNFYDFNGNVISSRNDYKYNEEITQPAPQDKAADNTYTYNFKGWASVDEKAAKNGYIVDASGRTDDGTYIGIAIAANSSVAPVARKDVYYVPVFEKVYIDYTVNFEFNDGDKNSQTVHYGENVTVPEVKASFFKDKKLYTFKNTWTKVVNGTETTGVNLSSPFALTENATYKAEYDIDNAKYTYNFYNYKGELIDTKVIEDGQSLNSTDSEFLKTVEAKVEQTYEDETNFYTLDNVNSWKDADGKTWTTSGVGTIPPEDNKDFYPNYIAHKFYNVSYFVDKDSEEAIDTVKVAAGQKIPAHEAAVKPGDKFAPEYKFVGWVDENDQPVSVMPMEDISLYGKYDCTPTEYTVTFVRDDGELISSKTYLYGEKIEMPTDEQLAKPSDNTYKYTFRDYDTTVSETCDGNQTYTAIYRRQYNYYEVLWMDEDFNIVKRENYIYNERLNPPTVVPESNRKPSDENHEYIFDGWNYLNDENEVTGKFERGNRVTSTLRLQAGYREVGKTVTVNFYNEDGSELIYTAKVEYGKTLNDITYPRPIKQSTEAVHFSFSDWKKYDGDMLVGTLGMDEPIVENLTVRAYFVSAPHQFLNVISVEKAPTFFEAGKAVVGCDCGYTYTDDIDPLKDSVNPTSKLYIKNHIWNSSETVEIGDESTAIPAAPNNNFIINTDDKAFETPSDDDTKFNASNRGSGIDKIEYAIVAKNETPTDWVTSFSYSDLQTQLYTQAWIEAGGSEATYGKEDANVDQKDFAARKAKADAYLASFETNFSAILGNIAVYTASGAELVDGDFFVVYVKVTDRIGNSTTMNSQLMKYDTTAPDVLVEGNHNGNRYCKEATIKVAFKNQVGTVTLNGETIELTDGAYKVSEAGAYTVVATDVAGNETKVNFEVLPDHQLRHYKVNPTCEKDGYEFDRCVLCGAELNRKPIAPMGHDTVSEYFAPTCTERGYTVTTCKNCGMSVKEIDMTEAGKETGHTWEETTRLPATCSKEGYYVQVCTVCGTPEKHTIEIDPDAHSFYREVVKMPTCSEDGVATKTCKYCGYVDKKTAADEGYKYLGQRPAHEYEDEIITAADCTTDGSKRYKCKNCNAYKMDAETGKEVVDTIPALGHDSYVYKEVAPTETEKGYTIYRCHRDGCKWELKVDGDEPLKTFNITVKVDGKEDLTIQKKQGEAITVTDLPNPKKDADETYKYTFSKWVDENGNEVTLPLAASKDMTLTAVFDSRYVNYTFTFVKEVEQADGSTTYVEVKKVGYLHYGDTVKLPEGPDKASDAMNNYTFEGWFMSDDNAHENMLKEYVVDGDRTFVAVADSYIATPRVYNVVFAINVDNIIYTTKVEAGKDADFPVDKTPTKAPDKVNHYKFAGWSAPITNIQKDTFVTAVFNSEKHDFKTEVVTEASCTEAQVIRYTCQDPDCGYSFEESNGEPTGHQWGPAHLNDKGEMVQTCTVCGAERKDETTYTVTFLNDDGSVIKKIGFVKYGEDIGSRVPADPTKPSTASTRYIFAGWYDEAGNKVDIETVVTKSATYKAKFDEEPLTYKVIYAIDSQHVLLVVNDVPGGTRFGDVAKPSGTPTKDYDANYHYIFAGWEVANDTLVTEDLYVRALFNKHEHSFVETGKIDADCEHGSSVTMTCSCGYSYNKELGAPLNHKWVMIESVQPAIGVPGYDLYRCTRCGKEERVDYPAKELINVRIKVVDYEGVPVEGATVSLYDGEYLVTYGSTNNDGVVVLQVPDAKQYRVAITVPNGEHKDYTVNIDQNGNISGDSDFKIDANKCECACHGNSLWSRIFRFFHKIIYKITGKFKCCSNPDLAKYGVK